MLKRAIVLFAVAVFLMTPVWINLAAAADQAAVEAAYAAWRTAMGSGSAKNVVELYSPNAVLLATFDANPLVGHEPLMAYFKGLTALPKLSVKPQKTLVRIFGDVAIASGTYEFSYDKNGKTVTVPARFSFAYKLDGDKWKIIDHHSSALPE